ncbi:hypothetical protein SR42_15370 [Clostridium botulinum]|uniref:hypothetical protein n=1 Tax=Clostridium botulinum TaxID=1491 RepID=UPI000596B09F|nr:hypothetical protein [Clostridium botulinum]KIL06942.1 hypothetical protein SR42_15370 [Clostridium botulinum]MBY6935251.1 hypothetical protein [Clostridium botulinum]MBY6948387.1 hypothetical protein [Clostridium botulinum]MBY7021400.1 hypothetical protein [Clostridium botulinum]NFH81795.1 hypothetical protein [Clostridium botulinum]
MISIKLLEQKLSSIRGLVQDVVNQNPDNDIVDCLEQNFDELDTMVLNVLETLDCILSDIEK